MYATAPFAVVCTEKNMRKTPVGARQEVKGEAFRIVIFAFQKMIVRKVTVAADAKRKVDANKPRLDPLLSALRLLNLVAFCKGRRE